MLLALLLAAAARADVPADLALAALQANPGIEALQARVAELEALARVADARPDPMAGLEYSNVPVTTFGLGDHPMAGLQLRVQQTLPYPGVVDLRQEVASSKVAVAEAGLEEARLRLYRSVEETWWSLVLVRQLRAVTAEHVERTDQLVAAVRARYETGTAGQHALLRLEVLRDKLADDLDDFERQDRQLTAALVSALHAEPGRAFATPDGVEPLAPTGDVATWLAQAEQQRPALAEQRAAAEGARLQARLARLDARPDLTVWGGYRVRTMQTETDPGVDLASVGVSVPIAVHAARVGEGQEAAALQAAQAARQREDALRDGIQAELESALATWARAERKARVYADELIPAASKALQATLSDYRVDKADFASLYQAEVQLLDLERARLAAVVQTHIQDAVIRGLTGQSTPKGAVR